MKWSHEALWLKTKLYTERAFGEDRAGELFPFWAILSFEFLARSTLARVHPVLLAQPDGEHILYACGVGNTKRPRSVPMKTVLQRCLSVVPGFLDDDLQKALALMELRNDELHTGDAVFQEFPSGSWLPNFFRLSELLLKSQGKTLEDLFSPAGAKSARETIEATRKEVVARAKEKLGRARDGFEALSETERSRRRDEALEHSRSERRITMKLVECPACRAPGLVRGETVHEAEARLVDGEITQEDILVPVAFTCRSCGLALEGQGELAASGIGDQYTIMWSYDPIEYFEIESRDFSEQDEYGND